MIQARCICGAPLRATEAEINRPTTCAGCSRAVEFVSGEALPDGAGDADFDRALLVLSGPADVARLILLGGCIDIEIGKLPDRHIVLPHQQVSRRHCTLVRMDFGPSRWRVEDRRSTNGLFVNGQRVDRHLLQDGDLIRIGGFELKFISTAPEPASAEVAPALTAAAPLASKPTGGPVCPSCDQSLAPKARICIDCGIHLDSGRPLLTAKGIDEEELEEKTEKVVRFVSIPVPLGFYPVASEAYGTHKPVATWVIAGITVLASLVYLVSGWVSDQYWPPGSGLMLWPPETAIAGPSPISFDNSQPVTDLRRLLAMTQPRMEFRWYQMLSHMMLHADLFHLAGNILFLLVFGTRVNALIGNLATVILYPLLGVAAAMAHLHLDPRALPVPMLGASGAIMGMAGIYLVFFPLHRVFMALWARWCLIFLPLIFRMGLKVSWTVVPVRGFWVLLFFIAFDVIYTTLGSVTGVAHWAHLGRFGTGAAIALALLLSRFAHARGGDILSVTLGKHAWPLIGKPSRCKPAAASLPRAVSLTYDLDPPRLAK